MITLGARDRRSIRAAHGVRRASGHRVGELARLTVAQVGQAHWFFGNLYEAVAKIPVFFTAQPLAAAEQEELLRRWYRLNSIRLVASGVAWLAAQRVSCTSRHDRRGCVGPR